ncbi:unnamed protein product [Effrenium voratum]|nr:unnamed protein product [Effrenium voratum]
MHQGSLNNQTHRLSWHPGYAEWHRQLQKAPFLGHGAQWALSEKCSYWSRRMSATVGLGHVSGLGGDLAQSFGNATAMNSLVTSFRMKQAQDCMRLLPTPGFELPKADSYPAEARVLAFHVGHDSNMAMSIGGRVQCVLELERLFGERYFHLTGYGAISSGKFRDRYQELFRAALQIFHQRCECDDGLPCPTTFDYGVMVEPHHMFDTPALVEEKFKVKRWRWVHHHEAHALFGFLSSPFSKALVVSYDGGGDDGLYNVFYGTGHTVQRIGRLTANFAGAYNSITHLLTEIFDEGKMVLDWLCGRLEEETGEWMKLNINRASSLMLGDAGKIMGYAAFAEKSTPTIRRAMKMHLDSVLGDASLDPAERNATRRSQVPREMVELACASKSNQDMLAAELQRQWQGRRVWNSSSSSFIAWLSTRWMA